MIAQLWGVTLMTLGLLVITDGYLGIVQQNTGLLRWLYMSLGLVLVIRGFMIMWPFFRPAPKSDDGDTE